MKLACEYGIKPDEFYTMIPSEFILFVKKQVKFLKDEEERHQLRFAQLQSTVANFSGNVKRGVTVKAQDFMPRKPQTQEQMLKQVEALNRIFGGEDKRVHNG